MNLLKVSKIEQDVTYEEWAEMKKNESKINYNFKKLIAKKL